MDQWSWLDLGMVIWWLFAGTVGLLALLVIAVNLKIHNKG